MLGGLQAGQRCPSPAAQQASQHWEDRTAPAAFRLTRPRRPAATAPQGRAASVPYITLPTFSLEPAATVWATAWADIKDASSTVVE